MLPPFDSNLSQFSSIHINKICFHVMHFNVLSSSFVLGPELFIV